MHPTDHPTNPLVGPANRSKARAGAAFTRKAALSFGATLALAAVASADERMDLALNAIAIGGSSRTDFGIGMLEGRAVLSPHLFLTAAPTILAVEGAAAENQLRTAATLLLQWGPIRFDDRNMWVFSDAGTTRYRNRLRLTAPVELNGRSVRLQLLDEAFHEQGGRGWFRNMIGAGVGIDFNRSVALDAYWMVQDDEGRPQTSIAFVVLTARVFPSRRGDD